MTYPQTGLVKVKESQREEIKEQVQRYLLQGGRIIVVGSNDPVLQSSISRMSDQWPALEIEPAEVVSFED
ncbi:MAG: hypothetical protein AAF542_22615 [Pseudomonadota bacterium]